MLIGIDASRALRAKRTGTERYSLEIIQHLLALPAAREHHWRLYVDQPVALASLVPSTAPGAAVELCYLPSRRMWTHRALGAEMRRQPPDLLFVPAHVLPFLWPLHRMPPSVATVHDLGYRSFPEMHTRSQRLALELGTRWSAYAATRVIAVSQATADDLRRAYATPAAKIDVIYEATTALPSATQADVERVRLDAGLDRPYALFVGSIQPRKNLARLIAAYQQLVQRHAVAFDLVVAGASGWLSDDLYALAQRSEGGGRIRFLGYVSDADLAALYRGSLFFAFPSLSEGFGLPVLEAQSMGVAVMTSTNSSLPEIAGDAALLVEPTDVDAIADAMLRLSRDEPLCRRLIDAGYVNVKRFSWEKAASATLAVFEAAARSRTKKGSSA